MNIVRSQFFVGGRKMERERVVEGEDGNDGAISLKSYRTFF